MHLAPIEWKKKTRKKKNIDRGRLKPSEYVEYVYMLNSFYFRSLSADSQHCWVLFVCFYGFSHHFPCFIRCFRSSHCPPPQSWCSPQHLFLVGFFPPKCIWFLFTLPTVPACIKDYPAGFFHCVSLNTMFAYVDFCILGNTTYLISILWEGKQNTAHICCKVKVLFK